MNRLLLTGVVSLAVLTAWLMLALSTDSTMVRASFVPSAHASNDAGRGDSARGWLDGCTDSCLYDVVIANASVGYTGYCMMAMEVKHKLYDPGDCCCHTAATIVLEVTQDDEECDCLIPMVMDHAYDSSGQSPCDYGVYRSGLFVVRSQATFYYKIWDTEAPGSCAISNSYYMDCEEP